MKQASISMDIEPDLHTDSYKSLDAIPDFLKLLKKYNIKASFFTTCDCIKKNIKLFKEIKKQGHEISLHGFEHKRFDILSLKEKQENLEKSIDFFQKTLKIKPKGFRAPQHSIDNETIKLLKKYKFEYDSSITPWNFYHLIFFWKIKLNFFHNFKSMKIHKIDDFTEIPLTSFILPFASITLRILPKFLLSLYFRFLLLFNYPIFLMHSWDLIEIPESKIYNLCKKPCFLNKLEFMLKFFSKRRKFVKLENLL